MASSTAVPRATITLHAVSSAAIGRAPAACSASLSCAAHEAALAASPERRAVASATRRCASSSWASFQARPAAESGTPAASVCATPATIPPCCTRISMVMTTHAQVIHPRLASLGPDTRSNASSGVRPQVRVVRPISTWAATFTTQPRRISQRSVKPASAPAVVVAMSSPLPTMELARMMPGPRWASDATSDRGGSTVDRGSVIAPSVQAQRREAWDPPDYAAPGHWPPLSTITAHRPLLGYKQLPPPGSRRRRKFIRCSIGMASRRRINSTNWRSLSAASASRAFWRFFNVARLTAFRAVPAFLAMNHFFFRRCGERAEVFP